MSNYTKIILSTILLIIACGALIYFILIEESNAPIIVMILCGIVTAFLFQIDKKTETKEVRKAKDFINVSRNAVFDTF